MQRSRGYLAQYNYLNQKKSQRKQLLFSNSLLCEYRILCWAIKYFASVHDFGYCVEEQAMSVSRCHAGLVILVVLSFCTFGRCTVLTFVRSENIITLRCVSDLQNQFPVQNAEFFVGTPDSSRRPIQNFTRGQRSHEIMFTLTPETEGNFFCHHPTRNEDSEELLLAGKGYKCPSLVCVWNYTRDRYSHNRESKSLCLYFSLFTGNNTGNPV